MCSTYEVVTSSETVLAAGGETQEFRLTAPTGKKPIAGGFTDQWVGSAFGDFPDGDDWVFRFYARPSDRTVNIYAVFAEL